MWQYFIERDKYNWKQWVESAYKHIERYAMRKTFGECSEVDSERDFKGTVFIPTNEYVVQLEPNKSHCQSTGNNT